MDPFLDEQLALARSQVEDLESMFDQVELPLMDAHHKAEHLLKAIKAKLTDVENTVESMLEAIDSGS